ncbi:MAG TPA: TonB-dependent siderophore receptor [Stenotrophomonas sp.]|nr:TonB-dependent siderophore receptor [Stenotrophomonas sp.]
MFRTHLIRTGALSAACLAGIASAAAAFAAEPTDLPALQVQARAGRLLNPDAALATKSELPLAQTPMSLDVLGRELLDSQQIHNLNQALQNAGGVVGGTFGRRGWDDFHIRGQSASHSVFLDGLRSSAGNRMAEQVHGLEQIEVLKGPASLLYGQVQPGGMVNLVSKRPRAINGGSADAVLGSFGLRQWALDHNQTLGQGRAALRINAVAMDSEDATDYVWSRERYLAPSLALDLGAATDFVLIASYQRRRYIRQQGLPLQGAVLPNHPGELRRTLFTGEPQQAPYDGQQWRASWQLDHDFGNGWRLHHGLRWQSSAIDGVLVTNEALLADQRTLRRGGREQHWGGRTWVQDTYATRDFGGLAFAQTLTIGVDTFRTWEWFAQDNCRVGTLDVYAPVYRGMSCSDTRNRDTLSVVTSGGLYLRDTLQWGEEWQLLLGLRQDRSRSDTDDRLRGHRQRNEDHATTGSAALMYQLVPGLRPYLSFATSFIPNGGLDAQARPFEPERGRQWELGAKYAIAEHILLSAALYDLQRRQVLQADPAHEGFMQAIGGQRSRGGEVSLQADLSENLGIHANYAYTDASISDDGGRRPSTVGTPLPNVPRHSGSLWLRYDPGAGTNGWYAGAGMRAAGARPGYGYRLPGYVVVDAALGYRQQGWDAGLNVRNLFNCDYFSGGLARAVAVGDPRTLSLRLRYRY